jgi:rubredoxin
MNAKEVKEQAVKDAWQEKRQAIRCPQCGLGEEIHAQKNGDLLCEICGWIIKYSEVVK